MKGDAFNRCIYSFTHLLIFSFFLSVAVIDTTPYFPAAEDGAADFNFFDYRRPPDREE